MVWRRRNKLFILFHNLLLHYNNPLQKLVFQRLPNAAVTKGHQKQSCNSLSHQRCEINVLLLKMKFVGEFHLNYAEDSALTNVFLHYLSLSAVNLLQSSNDVLNKQSGERINGAIEMVRVAEQYIYQMIQESTNRPARVLSGQARTLQLCWLALIYTIWRSWRPY